MASLPGMVPKCEREVVEIVIHITSVGEFSFLFNFIIISPFTIHCRGNCMFNTVHTHFLFVSKMLSTITLFGSLVFGFSLFCVVFLGFYATLG